MFDLRMKIDGHQVLDRRLRDIQTLPHNMKPSWEKIRDYLRTVWEARFKAEGNGWAPLKESTVRMRGSAHPILERTGELHNAVAGRGQDTVAVMEDRSAEFGVAGIKALALQRGRKGNMAARPFITITNDDKTEIIRIIRLQLNSKLRGGI